MNTILDTYSRETLRKVDVVLAHAERYINWDGWDIVLDEYTVPQIAELVKRTRTDKGAILKVMADVRPLIPAEKLAAQEALQRKVVEKAVKIVEAAQATETMRVYDALTDEEAEALAERQAEEFTVERMDEIADELAAEEHLDGEEAATQFSDAEDDEHLDD